MLKASFGVTGRVTRREYLKLGFALMALKYGVDALVYYFVVGGFWNPIQYLNPVYSSRMVMAPEARDLPPAYVVFLLLWGLLFAWIGSTVSARRAVDAGLSGWWGLFFFVPFCNYLVIVLLAAIPSSEGDLDPTRRAHGERTVIPVILSGALLLAVSALVFAVMVQGVGDYGSAVFVSLPVLFGIVIGALFNRSRMRGAGETASFAFASSVVACLALLLFAMEGLICIAMAFPIVTAAICAGALLGRTLVQLGSAGPAAPLCLAFALPVSAWVDSKLEPSIAREVSSSIEVDAPPSVVWEHVVEFSELPEPEGWLFDTGMAYPLRARIEGRGVGAVRYCEFSTGAFVEPITVWDEPCRLGFDVVEQPVPMEEWSFYDDVRPPHLTTTFRSVRGEFRLTALPGNRTLLEGSTWYELDMAPEPYWRIWGDAVIHRIHDRVLRHVRALSEGTR